ncbi:MAG: tetratricopeptide repeat protein [Pseudomonadota bacterium]
MKDFTDLPIAGATAETAKGYDGYVHEFLAYGANLRALFDVADAAPDCALVNAHAAALHLAFEGAEGWQNAAPFLDRMRRGASKVSERERLFCEATHHWHLKRYDLALKALDELTVRWPADLCAIKWGQYHAFNLGDQKALLRFAQRASVAHENRPYAHGMVAFAYEQNHELERAADEAFRATEIALDDAWAHHALAHVMETQGRAREGANWMAKCSHTWDQKGVFIRDHNWWHVALFHLSLGDVSRVLEVFDERLWGAWPEFPQEQIGAVSLLWRLDLRGVDVGGRWQPVIEQARARVGEHIFPFHDIHYLIALARGESVGLVAAEETDAFLASMKRNSETQPEGLRVHWRDAVVPCGKGIVALARGNREDAGKAFKTAMPLLHLIGGSHAQRHVFSEALDVALGASLSSEAMN